MSLAEKIGDCTARVGVIGLGYVGLPLAIAAAQAGYHVKGFDIDSEKMTLLDSGRSYIAAVGDQDIAKVSDRFSWTIDFVQLADCDVILICVPTPLTRHREPDLSYVERTAETIAHYLKEDTLVVLESTTYPGTTLEVLRPILTKSGLVPGEDFFVGYSPEREDPGNERFRTVSIPKIVSGDGEIASSLVNKFYGMVVERVVSVSSPSVAEAIKITENIFRSVNIALVNELKLIYEKMDIDVWEVIDGAATKPFGYMPFYPGPGLGGHCIPIDPFYLTWRAREFGISTRFIELAGEINTVMPAHVVNRVREVLDRRASKGLNGSRVLLVGIAYKKNVPDMRESPAMKLLELLESAGAKVEYHDPFVPQIPPMREYPGFAGRESLSEQAFQSTAFDAILIATDHDCVDYGRLLTFNCPIVDTRNVFARAGLSLDLVTKA